MDDNIYYKAPTDKSFMDMKACAMALWSTYDNTYGYVDEKVGRIKDLQNIDDNFMYIYNMFDSINQSKLRGMLKATTLVELLVREDIND